MATDAGWKLLWVAYVDRWHNERRMLHLAKSDLSPACGASYYASSGAVDSPEESRKCGRCLRAYPCA